MKRQLYSLLWSLIRRLVFERKGQVVALFALTLPAMAGGGALAVDMSHMFVTKSIMQKAANAGAQAGTAILAKGGTQSEAEAEALKFVRQNLKFPEYLTEATAVVTFPAPGSAQVSISHDIPFLFVSALGSNAVAVTTNATSAP